MRIDEKSIASKKAIIICSRFSAISGGWLYRLAIDNDIKTNWVPERQLVKFLDDDSEEETSDSHLPPQGSAYTNHDRNDNLTQEPTTGDRLANGNFKLQSLTQRNELGNTEESNSVSLHLGRNPVNRDLEATLLPHRLPKPRPLSSLTKPDLLQNFKYICLLRCVQRISRPRLAQGLRRLEWTCVSQ